MSKSNTYHYDGPVYAHGHYQTELHLSTEADTFEQAKRKLRYKAHLKTNQWVDFINPIRAPEPKPVKPAPVEPTFTQLTIKF